MDFRIKNAGRRHLSYLLVLAAVVFSGLMGGCASTDSDLPWNNPQPWEGSPTIPGMNR